MKIAVITYHYSNNKGAFMQTYALCRFLSEQGHQLHIIDVRQEETTNLGVAGRWVKDIIVNKRLKKDMASLYPPLTRRYRTMDELRQDPPEADCYIVGSDQVWNPNISKDLMFAYFLDFGLKETRRISYASSFGLSVWTISDKAINDRLKAQLGGFQSLSVREVEGQALCEKEFGLKPQVVLDPTFLNEDYPELIGKVKPRKEILCYKINKTQDFWENAPVVAKIMHLPLALLNYNYPKKSFRYVFPPSLKTWMRRIAAAEFIITDSFHGVAFSIINKKQFVVILNNNDRNSRLENIIRTFHLEDRMFESLEQMISDRRWEKPIGYDQVTKIVEEQRAVSRKYLLAALK